MLAVIGTGGGVGIMPAHAAKLPHAGCSLVNLTTPVVESELLLVTSKRTPGKEMESLMALVAERAAQV